MRNALLVLPILLAACSPQMGGAFDADNAIRIFETLSSDSMEGRRTGTDGNMRARAFLSAEIAKLDVFDSVYETDFTTAPRPGRDGKIAEDAPTYEAVNLNALIDIEDNNEGPLLVITAHYDHLGMRDGKIYNGADDNASGVAALFAVAQSFADNPPEHDVLFIWFDAEEMGLQGARHYISEQSFGTRPVFNLNLDMVSQNQKDEIYASGAYHTPALKPIISKASTGTGLTLLFGNDSPADGANDWTLQSDHGPFHSAGLPFLYFGVEDHPHYHAPTDTFDTIPLEFYEKSLKLIVQSAHALDETLDKLAKPIAP